MNHLSSTNTKVHCYSHTGSPGMESRHADERTSLDRHHRQTSLPPTPSSKNGTYEMNESSGLFKCRLLALPIK